MKEGERLRVIAPKGELKGPVMDRLQDSGMKFAASKGRLLHGGTKYTY